MSQQIKPQKQAEYHPSELIFIQSRAEINLAIVEEYAEIMAEGTVFDPVEGVQDENGLIYIFDGYHRGEAAKKVGMPLLVNLQPGNRTEAEWLALSANQRHGLRRSNEDKQRVVRQALRHPYGVNLSNSELARHCGVSDKTVAKIRREMETSSEIPKIDKRMVRRNGLTYEQDTRNIGGSQSDRQSDGLQPDCTLISQEHRLSPNQVNHDTVEPEGPRSLDGANQFSEHVSADIRPDANEQLKYQLRPQEFECPRCRQEKIVGINGSRRWCLNCGVEWPTAADFLTEVNAAQNQTDAVPTRTELQQRFLNILASLGEQDRQLIQVEIWLDELERRLVLSADRQPAAETVAPILSLHSIPILEYA